MSSCKKVVKTEILCFFLYSRLSAAMFRNLEIVIEAAEAQRAELLLVYQVYCATWRPAYDVRASTSTAAIAASTAEATTPIEAPPTGADASNRLELCYFGLIEQATGEDWNQAEIILSTATPTINGALAPLPTLTAAFTRSNSA